MHDAQLWPLMALCRGPHKADDVTFRIQETDFGHVASSHVELPRA